ARPITRPAARHAIRRTAVGACGQRRNDRRAHPQGARRDHRGGRIGRRRRAQHRPGDRLRRDDPADGSTAWTARGTRRRSAAGRQGASGADRGAAPRLAGTRHPRRAGARCRGRRRDRRRRPGRPGGRRRRQRLGLAAPRRDRPARDRPPVRGAGTALPRARPGGPAVAGGAGDAGDRRLPAAGHPRRGRGGPGRRLRRGAGHAAREGPDRGGGAAPVGRQPDPVRDHSRLPAPLRAALAGRPALPGHGRRPRRPGRPDRRRGVGGRVAAGRASFATRVNL
ncbi:MAG: Segregation and condensation protein B, partial [uncultured Thermomicrobiales bacterium]